ncbi:hypothetical protein Alches_27210 [Alicyclobacillus hesperidum subsp. aegles]|uniref:hypothetical protein n=1 Tax=Alicyclobacillus hesperidum TaxID=89784 RepID=UPI00222C3D56|nr:hypothetical protein [Alicyclobacillus hesperidum]GLG02680.1 hypothetical protein Alches_27210 [Alicyclobacillus hesperidum subsp. aegles]
MRIRYLAAVCTGLFLLSSLCIWLFAQNYFVAAYGNAMAIQPVASGEPVMWGVGLCVATGVAVLSAIVAAALYMRMAFHDTRKWHKYER